MTNDEQRIRDGAVHYEAEYRPIDEAQVRQPETRKALGFGKLAAWCAENQVPLELSETCVGTLEQELLKAAAGILEDLAMDVAAYAGDLLCTTHPGIVWEISGGVARLKISSDTTWDAFWYVEQNIVRRKPRFLNDALDEMNRIIEKER